MNKKVKKAEVKKVNGFTQSMNDCDYNLVEQYQEEQIAEHPNRQSVRCLLKKKENSLPHQWLHHHSKLM